MHLGIYKYVDSDEKNMLRLRRGPSGVFSNSATPFELCWKICIVTYIMWFPGRVIPLLRASRRASYLLLISELCFPMQPLVASMSKMEVISWF